MATTTTAARTKVVGYIRVSTEGQADGGVSLDAQRVKLAAYCEAMDLELVEVIEDAGVSAKTLVRPGLARVLEALETGRAAGVVVTKLDRLTRSVKDLGELVERFFAVRFALLSVSDSIDTRSAGGRLVLNVLASVAQWEREAIAERTVEALRQVKREGCLLGGEALGWKRTEQTDANGRRVVQADAAELAVLERIAVMSASGATVRAIASTLNSEGVQTKKGARWHATTVQRALGRKAA